MENQKKFIISTVFKSECKLIFLENLEITEYFNACCSCFNLPTGDILIELKTNLGATVDSENFAQVIENFSRSGSFYVELHVEKDDDRSIFYILTTSEFKKYLEESNAGNLIQENKTNERLQKTSQNRLIRLTAELALSRCGGYPSSNEKEMFAKLLIFLFPYLRYQDPNKPDIHTVFNHDNGGLLGQALKNMRARRKAKTKEINGSDALALSDENLVDSLAQMELNDDLVKVDFETLKLTLVNSENMSEIERKLKSTIEYRKKLMKIPETDVLECFPYFFTNPQLVLFDFAERFKNAHPNNFIAKWMSYANSLCVTMREFYQNRNYTEWQDDIERILMLLVALPFKPNGRKNNTDPILSFKKAVNKLIVFRKIGATKDELIQKDNSHPYIIACGDSKMEISYFYIEVEKTIVQIPDHFTIIDTFDVFYKIHMVLDLDFDSAIRPMMLFCAHFIYNVNDSSFKPTNKMSQLFNEISRMAGNTSE